MVGDIYCNYENIGIVKYHLISSQPSKLSWSPCLCCTIDPLSVNVWWSYWWNGSNSKVYTRRTNDEAIGLPVLFFPVLPRHTSIMTDKGFNLFYECAARCVHLFPQEEECTSYFRGDSKMYTSSSIANSQRM